MTNRDSAAAVVEPIPTGVGAMRETMQQDRPTTAEELCEAYTDEIWRFVSSQVRSREDAEDVVMEVFQAAFGQIHRVQRAESPRLWLLGIARNKVADSLRRRYRRREDPLDETHSFEAPETTELQEATRGALRALPDPQGQALVLKYVNGLSTEEVAQVLRKSLPATNSLLQRARGALREAVQAAMPATVGSQI